MLFSTPLFLSLFMSLTTAIPISVSIYNISNGSRLQSSTVEILTNADVLQTKEDGSNINSMATAPTTSNFDPLTASTVEDAVFPSERRVVYCDNYGHCFSLVFAILIVLVCVASPFIVIIITICIISLYSKLNSK